MVFEFKMPDIGEGLTEGEVIKWQVKEGDSVQENQPLVNILTDKAEVEIASPKTGKIIKLFAKEGQKIKVGSVLISFEVGVGDITSLLPGKISPHAPVETNGHAERSPLSAKPADDRPSEPVSATPAVRKLATELQVNLANLRGSGPNGRVTEEDVRKASSPLIKPPPPEAATMSGTTKQLEDRVPFVGIRRRTAEKMTLSARMIPHVTHADEADYTALAKLRQEFKPEAERRGIKLTFLPFIVKAVTEALKQFPNLNATLDESKEEIVIKHYYNIGIAMETEQGLVVPVVKNTGSKDIWDLAIEIIRLTEKARANKLEVADLQGGTFTVTNIGPVGGLFATPIILHPEVAILGVMKIQERPVVRDEKVVIRSMGNLCVAFDHRVLDGAQAANFTNTLIRHLENPRTLL